ncbi:hypothetical protein [Sinorhizobium sp. Sb3]|uniref:hypothetical protein n=1 Tax=Sinorhizobium/Ensifer group TaxID=227292 RepID=UPI00071E61DE|nr:hypothetical protein [Sinorhizobium sp. Sb3]KSV63448.1 hypothetical protein N183_35555 [Sinorhizobium sp. Sb3]
MADVSNTAIRATIQTREAADLADEHFVQHCISRPDVFIASASDRNTSGSALSGGDASHGGRARCDMPAAGEIEASADIASSDVATVRSLGDAGALRVSRH